MARDDGPAQQLVDVPSCEGRPDRDYCRVQRRIPGCKSRCARNALYRSALSTLLTELSVTHRKSVNHKLYEKYTYKHTYVVEHCRDTTRGRDKC